METWWATQGYGSSRSNRQEGAALLGRLVEYAALGRYVPGRRGYPTRIEWTEPLPPAPPPERAAAAAGAAAATSGAGEARSAAEAAEAAEAGKEGGGAGGGR